MLSKYLNNVSNYLLNNYSFYINNIDFINRLSYLLNEELIIMDDKSITNNLTYVEIFDIASDIICSINPLYLLSYIKLIENGILNFDYGNNSKNYFHHTNTFNDININRAFNYNDIISLIHEFIHYTSGNKITSNNRKILLEFFPVYFEFYSYNFLHTIGINNNEINYFKRFNYLYKCIKDYLKINIPLTVFIKEGKIVKNDYLLNHFIEEENKYNNSKFLYQRNNDELIKNLSSIYYNFFTYIFNTSIAIYAYNNCNIKDIVKLNDNVNHCDFLNINEILKLINIDIYDNDFFNIILNNIKEVYSKVLKK